MNYKFEKKKLKSYLGNDIYDSLKAYDCIIAGGMITSLFCNTDINDVDVYFRSMEDLDGFLKECVKDSNWILFKTDKALLINWHNIKVQLIYFNTFDNVQDLFNTFDFTVCMGAYDFKAEEFVLHDDFLKHNAQKILKFNSKTAYPLVSAFRIDKYKTKGYNISKDEFMRIMLTCTLLEINTYEQFKEQVGGMYGINYDMHLKPKENEKFNLISVIEKMSTLCLSNEYFDTTPNIFEIDNFDLFVAEITKCKIKYFELQGKCYKHTWDGISKISKFLVDDNSDSYEKVNLFGGIIKNNKLYKYVKKENDEYCSFYKQEFKYEIGKDIIAKDSPNGLSFGSGIYCGLYDDREAFSYMYSDKSVLIELEVNEEDLIDINSNGMFRFKKVKFIREVEEGKDKLENIY